MQMLILFFGILKHLITIELHTVISELVHSQRTVVGQLRKYFFFFLQESPAYLDHILGLAKLLLHRYLQPKLQPAAR